MCLSPLTGFSLVLIIHIFLEGGAAVRTGDNSDISWMKSRFLAGLTEAAVRQLLDSAHLRHMSPKKNVIVKGEHPDHIFLLKIGRTRSYVLNKDGSEIVLLCGILSTLSLFFPRYRGWPQYCSHFWPLLLDF
jgi:CRP-like cAMP-binding protein